MKTQNTYKNPDFPDFTEWIDEDFIEPLKEQGFTLKEHSTIFTDHDSGTHLFYFDQEGEDPDWEKVDQICTQDLDDNQPSAIYSAFFGSLWLYIPYYS